MESDGVKEAAAPARPPTAEEEALKRNTDCVYFLASPLTCKKGSECQYRHSDAARMNPRDCRYWLNGNCLNPKCPFRHPPLDGLFGPPTPTSQSSAPASRAAPAQQPVTPSPPAAGISKQNVVPCYYFQKGYCMKGEWCPFSHGPLTEINNPGELVKKAPTFPAEPALPQRKDLLKEFKPQNDPPRNVSKGIVADKPRPKVETVKSNLCISVQKEVSTMSKDGTTNAGTLQTVNLSRTNGPNPSDFQMLAEDEYDELHQNQLHPDAAHLRDWNESYDFLPPGEIPDEGRDADEFLGESSPGFDVLVDNDNNDAGYMHDEEHFGSDIYPVDEFDYGSADFDAMAYGQGERFDRVIEPDQLGDMHEGGGYEGKRRRASSERNLDRATLLERRVLPREEDLLDIDKSDLRHQLLKRRRINGHRSGGVHRDSGSERYRRNGRNLEGSNGSHRTGRDHTGLHRGSVSSRLQGRITIPERSLGASDIDAEKDRFRNFRGRLSSPDFAASPHRGKLRQRLSVIGVRNVGSTVMRGGNEEPRSFTGPKSLAELKGKKAVTDGPKVVKECDGSAADFEGPKPLSMILKKKRAAASSNEIPFPDNGKAVTDDAEPTGNENDDDRAGEREDRLAAPTKTDDDVATDVTEDRDVDLFEQQQEGDYEYEDTVEGGEDESTYQEDEDFEDEDDFARKIGAMVA